jgi:hypothetical protein
VQCRIGDDNGPIGRVDLVYLAFKIIIEYEGDQHRTDRGQWNRDIDRHEDFARDHWTLIRVTSERLRWPAKLSAVSLTCSDPLDTRGPSPPLIRHGATFLSDRIAACGVPGFHRQRALESHVIKCAVRAGLPRPSQAKVRISFKAHRLGVV